MSRTDYTLTLHTATIATRVQEVTRELRRLKVRLLAIERYRRRLEHVTIHEASEYHEETLSEMTDGVEALHSDISTYIAQVEAQLNKIEHGRANLENLKNTPATRALALYIETDVKLLAQAVSDARTAYDDLISRLGDIDGLLD